MKFIGYIYVAVTADNLYLYIDNNGKSCLTEDLQKAIRVTNKRVLKHYKKSLEVENYGRKRLKLIRVKTVYENGKYMLYLINEHEEIRPRIEID